MTCVRVLLPALITNEEQRTMTEECQKSLISLDNCAKIEVDTKPYEYKVAGVWNAFLDKWRGKEYDYLMIVANDTVADIKAIDYMIKYMEENPNVGIVTGGVERDKETFKKNFGQIKYDARLLANIETPCFMIRRGVIEMIGRIDNWFPIEFVERDYFYRCKLAQIPVVGLATKLFYHPNESKTVGYDDQRFQKAFNKYILKWGGDALREVFTFPFNDTSLDFTYTKL